MLRPEQCLTRESDGRYTFTFTSTLATSSVTFKLGEEFEEIRADGDKVLFDFDRSYDIYSNNIADI